MNDSSNDDSVTTWIEKLKEGDETSAQRLWERYFRRLVGLARQKLQHVPRRAADEEDVVVSAMDSFFRGAKEGRFPLLRDRNDLWPLLCKITTRKALNEFKREFAQKRGGGEVRGESAILQNQPESAADAWGQIGGAEPAPDFVCEIFEQANLMLAQLGDESLKQVAIYKLQGYSNEEIAAKLNCVTRTVERKLERIRSRWSREKSTSTDA